ncbi:peptidase S33 (plasmid) [Acidiphilium multivorum AIU301]|uniref:Peptidase S33 n=1 Tax=Acidiphilium multivorum (strain DSM 11245 / JCM 8867 / NBRC 100883 / AIU 301) TaxID=926570 RepID=F0J7U3_ACIMA|nr:proline iminopeptidase-family hydrolase [Acidiphilium multivorum]BAJ83160.1 peptidase S33 [Acidiphilium multivorum AIU301]GAN72944.1 peptidase S33 [Acidiphilium multivorum AIU301]
MDAGNFAPFDGYRTWYRVSGDLEAGGPPLVVLHGGPGAAHDYVDRFRLLATPRRAVIHYDQLGCGRSTHLPDRGAAFWTVDLFLAELDNLLDHLGIRDRYAVLGQSWGGMLAAEHAVRRPPGLKALVIANSPASMVTWVAEANRLRAELPAEVQQTLLAHERAGTTDHPDYEAAVDVFYHRHLCRLDHWPDEVKRSFAQMAEDPTVYHTMNGPSEFHVIGTLRTWDITERLHVIAVPTLVLSGAFDEATPETVRPYVELIEGARWVLFDQSSHMPHVEETARCMDVVGGFLDTMDEAE